ncbi:unnamed protein product, partial [Staurois parvus]
MYVKWFDTVIFYYVILVILVNVTFYHFFKFPAVPSPVCPDIAGNGTQKTDASIRWRTLEGTLQGGHRGSAGQGKRRTDPGAVPHGKPECSSGVTACVTLGNTARGVKE